MDKSNGDGWLIKLKEQEYGGEGYDKKDCAVKMIKVELEAKAFGSRMEGFRHSDCHSAVWFAFVGIAAKGSIKTKNPPNFISCPIKYLSIDAFTTCSYALALRLIL